MPSQQQTSKTPKSVRDSWETPEWLYQWAHSRFNFQADLASSADNAKCGIHLTSDDDALIIDWMRWAGHMFLARDITDGYLFLNPPYSETGKWVEKAWHEAQKGARVVMLIPSFNGDKYWEHIHGKASLIINIVGRVSFITSVAFTQKGKNGAPDKHYKAGDEVPGNNRGSSLVVFDRTFEGHTNVQWINRDDMRAEFEGS